MPPSVFWPLGYSRACDHERMKPSNKHMTCSLLPCQVVGMCWIGFSYLCSFDVTPIGETVVHLIIHDAQNVFSSSSSSSLFDEPILLDHRRMTQHK